MQLSQGFCFHHKYYKERAVWGEEDMAQGLGEEPITPTAAGQQQAAHTWALYNKLWNFVMSEIQRKVLAGSFNWKSILDVDALLGQAAVAIQAFLIKFMATSKSKTLSSVLTQTCNAQEVFLVKSDVIKAQAMSISGGLWFSTHSLQNKGRLRQL